MFITGFVVGIIFSVVSIGLFLVAVFAWLLSTSVDDDDIYGGSK